MSRKHFVEVANLALEQAIADARAESDQYDCMPFSDDYQAGFLEGYVDHLEAGGHGAVQPTPPRRYWKARYQNPAGFSQMEQWVVGFQHGTQCAQVSNYRSYVVLPLGEVVTMDTTPYPYGHIDTWADVPTKAQDTRPVEDEDQADADRYANEQGPNVPNLFNSYQITQLPAVLADEDRRTDHAR